MAESLADLVERLDLDVDDPEEIDGSTSPTALMPRSLRRRSFRLNRTETSVLGGVLQAVVLACPCQTRRAAEVATLHSNRLRLFPRSSNHVQCITYAIPLVLTPPHRFFAHMRTLSSACSPPPSTPAPPPVDEIDLSEKELTEVPPAICTLTALNGLFLEDNQLTGLPDGITALEELTELYLRRNKLKTLPANIGALTNLDTMYLEDNELTAEGIPASFGLLCALKGLPMHRNKLTSVPAPIFALIQLEELYLDYNQLTEIPGTYVSVVCVCVRERGI